MDLIEYLQYVLALVFVLALIGLTGWLLKRFGAGGTIGGRRGSRLAVLDAAVIDKRRRLLLIRRDDVEHLIMIGGPQDLVIESGIRADPAGRRGEPQRLAPAVMRDPSRTQPAPALRQPAPQTPPAEAEMAVTGRTERPATAEREPGVEGQMRAEARAERPTRAEPAPIADPRPVRESRPQARPVGNQARPAPRPARDPVPTAAGTVAESRPSSRPLRPAAPAEPAPRPAPVVTGPVDDLDDLLLGEPPHEPRLAGRAGGGRPGDL